jgi:hypothetical protein
LKLFTAISDDAGLLRHFLNHYEKLGVSNFLIAVSETTAEAVSRYQEQYNITIVEGLDTTDAILGGASAVTAMRNRYQDKNEWSIIVDLDEFLELRTNIVDVIKLAEQEGANLVRATMWDRFSIEGLPVPFDPSSDLPRLYPVRARFTGIVMMAADFKGVLVKGLLKSVAAHHTFEDERAFSQVLDLSHYKWTAIGVARMRRAWKAVSEAGLPFGAQYKRALDHYDHHGRFAWEAFGGEIVAPPT